MNLTFKDIKNKNHIYNYQMLKQIFQGIDFFVVFFFDVFDSETRNDLFLFLNNHNLKSFLVKNKIVKSLLKKKEFLKLKNLFINNTIIIFNKKNELINNTIIKNLIKKYNLSFLFCVWYKKIYKINSFENYYLNETSSNLKIIFFFKQYQNYVLKQLLNKKFLLNKNS